MKKKHKLISIIIIVIIVVVLVLTLFAARFPHSGNTPGDVTSVDSSTTETTGAPGSEESSESPVLLEDEGEIEIVIPEGMDGEGF